MGAGWSDSTINDPQSANSQIAQRYSGTCQISCANEIDDASIAIINSSVGGDVGVTQSCSANAQCIFDATQSALADTIFKATNSSSAALRYLSIGITTSNINSPQTISESISQSVAESCKLSSINDMNDVSIFAANSQIGGSVVIGQIGDVQGGCTLETQMQASALASGTTNDCAETGSKKSCGGKGGKSSIGRYVLYGLVGIVLFMVVMFVIRLIRGSGKPAASATNVTPAPSVLTQTTPVSPSPVAPSPVTLVPSTPSSSGTTIIIENSVPGGVTLQPTSTPRVSAAMDPRLSAARSTSAPRTDIFSAPTFSPFRNTPSRSPASNDMAAGSPLGYSTRSPSFTTPPRMIGQSQVGDIFA